MRIHYILDEGLAHQLQTGVGLDTVTSLQSAIKYLVKSKEVMACDVTDIEVYALGVTKETYVDAIPLNPDDKLPKGSTSKNAIFAHVPREKQNLEGEQRRLYSNPAPPKKERSPSPKRRSPSPKRHSPSPKTMARPPAGQLKMTKPKLKKKPPESVEVTVRCADGKQFQAKVDLRHRISDLKKQFEGDSGVPANNQNLFLEGSGLESSKTASDSGIKNGTIIDLEPKSITVQVRTPEGNRIPVRMRPSDKIRYIKESVAGESGIEVPQQILKYNGEELPNSKTAKDMDLRDGSIVDLKAKNIQVNVITPNGKTIPVRMKLSNTVNFIKEKVAPASGVKVLEQVLTFNGKELSDGKSANDSGLTDGSNLYLEPKPIQVHVRIPDGKTIPVRMKPSDTIRYIKEKVAPECGIEVPQQVLTFNDKELPNGKSADETGLKDGSIIDLQPNTIQVHVRIPDGKTIPVRMKPSDTIRYIKEKVAPECGFEVPQQILKYNGKELSNGKSADEARLKDGSIIDLQPNTIQVHIRTPDGQTTPVRMKHTDTIQYIKEKVAPECGIEVPQQVLKYNGKELPNGKSAADVGLKDGSVIDLEPKTIQVHVRTPDGKTIPVVMKPSDTIRYIKEKVAPECEIEPPKQVLKFNGNKLPSGQTANEAGLQDGSVLDLEMRKERKKMNKDNDDLDAEGWKSTDYSYDYNPTPFDTSTQKCFYQLGDTVPYYIRINGWEEVGMLKQRIMETRGGRKCPYLKGATDPSKLQVYPAGETPETGGTPLGADEKIPINSSFEVPLIVVLPGIVTEDEKKKEQMDRSIQDQVRQRMATRARRRGSR